MTKSPEEDTTERTSNAPSEVETPSTGTEKTYDALREDSPKKENGSEEPVKAEAEQDTPTAPVESTNSEEDFSESQQSVLTAEGSKEAVDTQQNDRLQNDTEEPGKAEDQSEDTPSSPVAAVNSEEDRGDIQKEVTPAEENKEADNSQQEDRQQDDVEQPVKEEDERKDTSTPPVNSVHSEDDQSDSQKAVPSIDKKETRDSQQDETEQPIKTEDQRKGTPTPSEEPINKDEAAGDSQGDNVLESQEGGVNMNGQGDEVVADSRPEDGVDKSESDGKTEDAEPKSTTEDDRGGDSNADTSKSEEQPAPEDPAPQTTTDTPAEAVSEQREDSGQTQDTTPQADGGEDAKNAVDSSSQALAVEAADTRPATQEADYEDDFSEVSEKSDRAAAQPAVTAPAGGEEASEDTVPKAKSPTPSGAEEPRAEAGVVVPVPVPLKKSDGRSLAEERGEIRGEDRSEVQADGGEDSRGMGQWKSEEELFLQSTLTNQQAEKEALQAVIDEKVKIQKDYDDLKGRYVSMEEGSKQGELEKAMLKEKCQQQEQRIQALETEEARLRDFEQWGKDNEAKIRDLQERLASLAGEDAEKDRRVARLQEELQETKARLVAAERQTALNTDTATQHQASPKSKTCTIL